MARVPRGYKRGSGGFLQPIGSVPSGRVSGPRAGETGLGGERGSGITREMLPRPRSAADKRILASFGRAQKAQEGVMAMIASAENATFKRLNDALIASREVDAKNKDALGNPLPPSAQTAFLTQQMGSHLQNRSQRGKALTPAGAGVTPGELAEGEKAGWGGNMFPEQPIEPFGPRGVQPPMGQPGMLEAGDATTEVPMKGQPTLRLPTQEPEMFPVDTPATTARGDKVTLKGPQRMGPKGPEYLVVTEDGKEAWLPRASFEVAEEPGTGRGAAGLLRHFEKPVEDFQPF